MSNMAGPTAAAGLAKVSYDPSADTTRFHLTLIEGRKRQIRRRNTISA